MDTITKQTLKAQAHHLKPVILLGNKGLTPAVITETDHALKAHQLIKVKLNSTKKDEKSALAAELASALQAEVLQIIGNTLVLFRQNPDD